MNKSTNDPTRPCSVLRFHKSRKQKSLYHCCHKEGIDVLDRLSTGFSNRLLLGYDYHYDGEDLLWSLSIGTKLVSFSLTMERRACVAFDDYALLVEISEDFDNITLLFYEGLGRYASNLLTVANHDLLEFTVAPVEA
jgi:hypothetical protein